MKLIMTILTLLFIVSCDSGGGSSSSGGDNAPKTINVVGSTYGVPEYLTRAASWGGEIDYSCNDTECVVSGSVMGYYLNHNSQIVYIDFTGVTLTKNSNGYRGQVDYNNPPHVGSFNLTLGDDFKLKYLDNGSLCLYSFGQANEQQHSDYVNAKIGSNEYDFNPINFNSGVSMATCNM